MNESLLNRFDERTRQMEARFQEMDKHFSQKIHGLENHFEKALHDVSNKTVTRLTINLDIISALLTIVVSVVLRSLI